MGRTTSSATTSPLLKGNHLLQFGGQYQHDFDYHSRSDNGGGINFTPTYRMGERAVPARHVDLSDLGGGYPITAAPARLAAAVLGIVDQSQVAYTRAGRNLSLNPPLTHAFDKDVIPFYNAYVSDTWHMKPSLTLTYGMGYTLEMPPHEAQGKQTVLVDAADEPVVVRGLPRPDARPRPPGSCLTTPKSASLSSATSARVRSIPINPFYGSFSPRVGFAWNPGFSKSTVSAAGYGRIYGRLNGVDLVLVPLLGVGLIQAPPAPSRRPVALASPAQPTATISLPRRRRWQLRSSSRPLRRPCRSQSTLDITPSRVLLRKAWIQISAPTPSIPST